jgi:hypothetical protein
MASNGSGVTAPTGAQDNPFATETKGKGKALASDATEDHPMGDNTEEDDDDDEEEEVEDVCTIRSPPDAPHYMGRANTEVTGG